MIIFVQYDSKLKKTKMTINTQPTNDTMTLASKRPAMVSEVTLNVMLDFDEAQNLAKALLDTLPAFSKDPHD